VLEYYGLPRDKARYVTVKGDDVADSFKLKKIDAMIVVGPVTSKQVIDAISDAARGVKGAIQFIDIAEADAIVKRVPALESIEIDQGAFGGRPPRPADSFNTLGYSIRLVATPKTGTDTIAELVRQLYLLRQNLAAAIPGAGLMEAPDVDEATPFLIHPGVRAYVNGEQKSWFDRYNDWIYLGMFVASGVGSVIAAAFGLLSGRRELDPAAPLRKMQPLLEAAREAPDAAVLDRLEHDADQIFTTVYDRGIKDELSASTIASFDMARTELRRRIVARREALAPG